MTNTKPRKRAHPIRDAIRLSRSPRPTTEPAMCLRETRELLRVGPVAPDAIGAWKAARRRHGHHGETDLHLIPPGVPIFWAGGSEGHGHVAIKAVKEGHCWSVDIRRPGFWDRVPISEIAASWGLTFLGWTEDLNGVTVYPNVAEEVRK